MQLTTNGAQAAFYDLASDDQLDFVPRRPGGRRRTPTSGSP